MKKKTNNLKTQTCLHNVRMMCEVRERCFDLVFCVLVCLNVIFELDLLGFVWSAGGWVASLAPTPLQLFVEVQPRFALLLLCPSRPAGRSCESKKQKRGCEISGCAVWGGTATLVVLLKDRESTLIKTILVIFLQLINTHKVCQFWWRRWAVPRFIDPKA